MPTVGAYEAKTRFSELLRKVQQGERITITRYGDPVAVLSPVESAPPRPLKEIVEHIHPDVLCVELSQSMLQCTPWRRLIRWILGIS